MMKEGEIYVQGTPEKVFNAENLHAVFGLSAKVIKDPESDSLICIPIKKWNNKINKNSKANS